MACAHYLGDGACERCRALYEKRAAVSSRAFYRWVKVDGAWRQVERAARYADYLEPMPDNGWRRKNRYR